MLSVYVRCTPCVLLCIDVCIWEVPIKRGGPPEKWIPDFATGPLCIYMKP